MEIKMKQCDFIINNFKSEKVFNQDECKKIIGIYNNAIAPDGLETERSYAKNCKIIYKSAEHEWIFQVLASLTRHINEKYYNFFLEKQNEYFEIVKFQQNDYFPWKKDIGPGKLSTRKISLMLFLSENKSYEGGLINWFHALKNNPDHVEESELENNISDQEQGNVIVFPSYKPYRMNALTSGEKYVLTTWALGDHFC
jgi:hypothetical protein